MIKLAAAALIGAAAITLAAPAHADTNEVAYVSVLRGQGIHGLPNSALIQLGYAICADFNSGTSFMTEVEELVDNTQLGYGDAGYVIGAAHAAFCPSTIMPGYAPGSSSVAVKHMTIA